MARYTKDNNGNLILTAGGTRIWVVTQAAHDRAVSAGTAPNNCVLAITDDYVNKNEDGNLSVTSTSGTVTKQIYSRRGDTFFIHINITLTSEIAAGDVFYCQYTLPVTLANGFGMHLCGVAEKTSDVGDVPVTGYASQTELYVATSVRLPIGTKVEFSGAAPIAI